VEPASLIASTGKNNYRSTSPSKILLVQGELPGRISVLLVKEALGF